MVHIHCVLPEDRAVDESPADMYKFIYSTDDAQEAKAFCKEVLDLAYIDVKFGKRLLVLINFA